MLRLCRRVRCEKRSGGRPASMASFVSTRPSRHGKVWPMSAPQRTRIPQLSHLEPPVWYIIRSPVVVVVVSVLTSIISFYWYVVIYLSPNCIKMCNTGLLGIWCRFSRNKNKNKYASVCCV
jgi:hypothetical protein